MAPATIFAAGVARKAVSSAVATQAFFSGNPSVISPDSISFLS
jgi:hypothetical protein